MAAAETTKNTADATKASTRAASTPQPFALAGAKAFRESMEKSIAAVSELNAQSKKNLDAVVASATAAAKGAEIVGARAIAYSKRSIEDQVAAAKTIAGAKSMQEAFELQTSFAKTAFESYVAETGAMAEMVAASMKQTLSPLNERLTALVERVQTAR
ncbi:MAG TPA: TIGR01841 family phasin [Caulobacteraceae bacterium]